MPNEEKKVMMVKSTSEPCFDFTLDGENRLKKTVIISPIRIEEYEKNKFKITYGCSRGIYCKDKECRYVKTPKKPLQEEIVINMESFYTAQDR